MRNPNKLAVRLTVWETEAYSRSMRGPWSLSLSQLRAGSSLSDCPPAVHPLSPRPTPTSAFRAVVPAQLGPDLQPTGLRVSATCSGLSTPSPRRWTLAHPNPIRRALRLRGAPGHHPRGTHGCVQPQLPCAVADPRFGLQSPPTAGPACLIAARGAEPPRPTNGERRCGGVPRGRGSRTPSLSWGSRSAPWLP